MQNEWMIFIINLGGIAEVFLSFCPLGGKSFFLFHPKHSHKKERSFIPSLDEKMWRK